VQAADLPFSPAPGNINYFTHFRADHRYYDPDRPIVLLHYHDHCLDVTGRITPPIELDPTEHDAVAQANRQIRADFNNTLFWNFRYATHPERGSGIGSRGEFLQYKRRLLIEHGIEGFASVLDYGCGDLEVLRALDIKDYLGVDLSAEALDRARESRPDWRFAHSRGLDIPPADLVICFEVLIHQTNQDDYLAVIDFLAKHTRKTLIVSGYEHKDEPSGMVYFHEPLSRSLNRSGRFREIALIGEHTDVQLFRCDV
jgi:hypothetical protein